MCLSLNALFKVKGCNDVLKINSEHLSLQHETQNHHKEEFWHTLKRVDKNSGSLTKTILEGDKGNMIGWRALSLNKTTSKEEN